MLFIEKSCRILFWLIVFLFFVKFKFESLFACLIMMGWSLPIETERQSYYYTIIQVFQSLSKRPHMSNIAPNSKILVRLLMMCLQITSDEQPASQRTRCMCAKTMRRMQKHIWQERSLWWSGWREQRNWTLLNAGGQLQNVFAEDTSLILIRFTKSFLNANVVHRSIWISSFKLSVIGFVLENLMLTYMVPNEETELHLMKN